MLKSEGIQSPTHSDGSGNSTDGLGEDAIEQQWDALVDELKEEEVSALICRSADFLF